jgi:hypothetical protein
LAVEVDPTASLVKGGKTVAVPVTVTCPTGTEVVEAFLYVTQNGNQTPFTSSQPICDGRPHTLTVRAQAVGFRFRAGQAQVSGYVLLSNGASASPVQTVTLRHGQR